jgi:hypothetical protein
MINEELNLCCFSQIEQAARLSSFGKMEKAVKNVRDLMQTLKFSFDYKTPLPEAAVVLEKGFFPEEFKASQDVFEAAMGCGDIDCFSFDVFGHRLIDSPITSVLDIRFPSELGRTTNCGPGPARPSHVPTLLFRLTDYFQNQMDYDFS